MNETAGGPAIQSSEQSQSFGSGAHPHSAAPLPPEIETPKAIFDHTKALIAYHLGVVDETVRTGDLDNQLLYVRKALTDSPVPMWDLLNRVLGSWKKFEAVAKKGMSKADKKTFKPTVDFLFRHIAYWVEFKG